MKKARLRILSTLMSLTMSMTLLPVTAFAAAQDYDTMHAAKYTFTINGKKITEAGCYTLEGAKVESADSEGAAVHVKDASKKEIELLKDTPEAISAFRGVFEWEHTDWEKEADGVYIAGTKITENGSYDDSGKVVKSVIRRHHPGGY